MNRVARKLSLWSVIFVIFLSCAGCIFDPDYIEVTTEESVFTGRFYYEQLVESDKLLYREIYQGIMEQKENFTVHSVTGEKANDILAEVLLDSPELFWTDGHVVSTAYNDSYTEVEPTYNCTVEERERKQNEIDGAVTSIVNSVPAEYGEYDKVKYIYEHLINSVEYVEDAPDNQNMYSALVGKATVCAGYAKANQYLLKQLGLECIYVTGTAISEEKAQEHAWNIVRCNGNYYYVDVTWGDPLFATEQEQSPVARQMVYDYLCCNENALASTHTIKDGYAYPSCQLDDLNYYRLNGLFYETFDRNQIRNAMYRTIDQKGASTIFKFANNEIYTQAKDRIINELLDDAIQRLGRKYGLREVTCYYREDPNLNKFIVDWTYQ